MTDAVRRYDRASSDLVRGVMGARDASPERAAVEQISAEMQFRANAATFRASQQMYAALLDIHV